MSRASQLERLMLDLVNEERLEAGLDALRLERRLNESSEDHSAWMLGVDRFSHTGKDDSSAGDRMRDAGFDFEGRWTWGENIAFQSERGAKGLADDVRDLHRALMDSPGHRANILNPDFEVVGVGIERGDYKGYDAVMVTQNFARTSAPLQIDGGASGPGRPEPEPDAPSSASGGGAPRIDMRDFSLGPGQFTGLNRHKSYADDDGDPPLRYEIEGPSDAFVRVAGRTVDVEDGHVLDAGQFGRVVVRFDPAGEAQTFRVRVEDEDGWSDWDSFTITAEGGGSGSASRPSPEGDGLRVEADDVTIEVGERVKLVDYLAVETDGDSARSFKIQADEGAPNLWMSHRGEIDASDGLWIGAKAMGRLYVEAGDGPSEREMRILVSDGDDRSDWDAFVVTTEWDLA